MASNFALTPDQVKRAVDTVIQNNPAYADMLGFYGRLFDAQEACKSRLHVEPLQIPDDVLDDVSNRDHAHNLARVQHWQMAKTARSHRYHAAFQRIVRLDRHRVAAL